MIQRTLYPGYCIDTSALIDLWRRYYPPDIFQSLWKDIEKLIYQGFIIAPQEVLKEIIKQDDELLEWAKRNRRMFEDLDEDQLKEVKIIGKDFPNFIDPNKEIDADPFLVALAKTKEWTIITSEKPNPGGRPKIPDVCKKYNVKCLSLIEFFREKAWKY
jgi:hypothetical protein